MGDQSVCYFDPLLEDPGRVELHPAVECGLPAEGQEDAVRPLGIDHL